MRSLVAFLAVALSASAAAAPRDSDVIGTHPPEWTVSEWISAEPMTLASLRGKVVVVRWWTGPACPYCAGSMPVLNEVWRESHDRGVAVIGMYHHKSSSPLTREHVVAQRKRLGIEFPVAIDDDWKTLKRWWLDGRNRAWTSVTFVLDRKGVIRHVHRGGEIAEGSADAAALKAAIAACL